MKKFIRSLVFAGTLLAVSTQTVFAATPPNFPSCSAPQGSVIASYPSGTHGVPGNSSELTGSDTVYVVSEAATLQCFCSDNGSGIQTNWWKATGLTENEISVLTAQGWVYIPDGSVWGLDKAPYLALSAAYSCKQGGTGGGGGSSSNNNSSSSNIGGGQVLSAETGEVLGLADTGNIVKIYAVFTAAFITFGLASYFLKKASR